MSVHVLITGSNSGIGYAIAKLLLTSQPSYHVILACRTLAKSKAAYAQLQEETGNPQITASVLELDVDKPASIQAAVKTVTETPGKLDVLINNAGIFIPTKSLKAQLVESFRTNVIGPAMTTESFTSLLAKSSNPYVVHVGSGLGSLTVASGNVRSKTSLKAIGYRTSKAALSMLAIENDKELHPLGIKVFVICPGLIESDLRGTDEKSRTVNGTALKPETSAVFVRDILEGKRDDDVGKFLYDGGLRPW